MVESDSRGMKAEEHANINFVSGDRNLVGVVRAREGLNSQTLVMTGEGGEGTDLSRYSGTETGNTQVGG